MTSANFSLLLDEDDESDVAYLKQKGKQKIGIAKGERTDRHLRKREHTENDWASDEGEKVTKRLRGDDDGVEQGGGNVKNQDEGVEIEAISAAHQRLQDLKDRDAFAGRLQKRDQERVKKVVENRSSRRGDGGAVDIQRQQLADDVEAKTQALPSLRQYSRQEYLTKREVQQIELLRKEIADDEALFHGMKVSRRERQELERKKELLKLVDERVDDAAAAYQLPDDYLTEDGKIDSKKKTNALYRRYEEAKLQDKSFMTDTDQWEASQTQHSMFKTGVMDEPENAVDYEYVFDEGQTIKFVLDNAAGGFEPAMGVKEKLLQKQIEEAEIRGK